MIAYFSNNMISVIKSSMFSGSFNPKKFPFQSSYVALAIYGYAGLSTLVVLSVSLCVSNHWNNIHRSGKRNDHRARKGALYTKYIVAVFMVF